MPLRDMRRIASLRATSSADHRGIFRMLESPLPSRELDTAARFGIKV
jgi:hypothetical protein